MRPIKYRVLFVFFVNIRVSDYFVAFLAVVGAKKSEVCRNGARTIMLANVKSLETVRPTRPPGEFVVYSVLPHVADVCMGDAYEGAYGISCDACAWKL